jgi:hypothetical protein
LVSEEVGDLRIDNRDWIELSALLVDHPDMLRRI